MGNQSPLGSPYFLGGASRVLIMAVDPALRGRAVQELLSSAAAALPTQHTKWGPFWAQLLELTYFRPVARSVPQLVLDLHHREDRVLPAGDPENFSGFVRASYHMLADRRTRRLVKRSSRTHAKRGNP